MTSCFPDVNVWLALSVPDHLHGKEAWDWLRALPSAGTTLIFARHTQIGLLRLLTSRAVMGERTLNLRQAWEVYDRWLDDPRVQFHPEPRDLDTAFREIAAPFRSQSPTKAVADCYLLAFAKRSTTALVTFDQALRVLAEKNRCACIVPA